MKRSPNVRSRPGPIRVIVPLIAALTLAGCAQGEPLPIQSSPAPSFGVVASNAGRTGSPTAPTPGLVGSGAPALIRPGAFATSVVDALRGRTLPLIAPESRRLEPLLPRDATLCVLAGPVAASGYTWFQVVPVASRSLPNG